MTYPLDFPVPQDSGGPGAGAPIGGFGGNPAADRSAHRDVVARVGKAPVLLVHGNGGAADVRPWDLLDQRRFLLAAGYSDELIWAPSYLGPGSVDLQTPHTNNVDDVRGYVEAVCEYLGVDVVDVVAHSLGCSLMYAVFRGLDRRTAPVTWNQPKKWNRVGTFVSLAGAFHGLGTGSIGEWRTAGEFMTELRAETQGGGGETPFGTGKPHTPPPIPHTIRYFCGVAARDFVDAQNPGTGRLAGATNVSYNLGSGTQGHQAVKESQFVFNDFLPLLNSVPPVPAVTLTLDRETGPYAAPLIVRMGVDPADLDVQVVASRLTKEFVNGYLSETVIETLSETLCDADTVTLEAPGLWELTAVASGAADPITRTYWVGVEQLTTTFVTQSSPPFDTSLLVTATASDPTATLYNSLDGTRWTEGAAVTITSDSVVFYIAIEPDGIASEVVSRSFSKRIAWDDAVSASAVNHFIAGRVDVTQYLAYSDQFGFFTPFTLYLINGNWVLDPEQPAAPGQRADQLDEVTEPVADGRPLIRLAPTDPAQARRVGVPFAVTVEATSQGEPSTVHYTRDGSIPSAASPSFTGSKRFEIPAEGRHIVACCARDGAGNRSYRAFAFGEGA